MPGMLTSSRMTANSVLQHLAQRLLARARADQVLAEVLEHGPEDEQLLRQVVDDQDVGPLAVGRSSPSVADSSVFSGTASPQDRQQVLGIDRLGEVVPRARLDALLAGRPSSPWR